MWRDVFGFNRAETFALVLLLMFFCLGGGIYLYQKSSEVLPAQLIFEPVELPPVARKEPSAPAAARDPRNSVQLRLNLNTAPAESLELLPHVGQVISRRILDFRESVGGFDSVGQLVEVRGIGAKRLAQLRPYLTVE